MGDFRMPSLGADMDAGTLAKWLVTKGARVKRGDIVALVETEKGVIEIEIWQSGVVAEILVEPGAKVPVGSVLAIVSEEATPPAVEITRAGGAAPPPHASQTSGTNGTSAAVTPTVAPSTARHVRASPAARQLAREHDLDLAQIHGTGPHDAVTRGDVARALTTSSGETLIATAAAKTTRTDASLTPKPAATPDRGAAMRKAIASAMARSKREIPHYYLGSELDVSRAVQWLETENAQRSVSARVVLAALLLKATALALREVPELNGFFVDEEFRPSPRIHIGMAIALRGGGLVAPAIHDTDQMPLPEIMVALRDLVSRARAGSLRSSEMSDPTITITNLGDQGIDTVYGVIYPPQVAIVGFGTLRERPIAEHGMLGVRPIVAATLAGDHRVSDGHRGARFLARIARLLTEPEKL